MPVPMSLRIYDTIGQRGPLAVAVFLDDFLDVAVLW